MEKSKTEKTGSQEIDLGISAEGLMGKQSVRATFRLPMESIELLDIVASHLGLMQKTLFDQLIEDVEVLHQVAQNARVYNAGSSARRQKTFVLSKRSLQILDKVAKQQRVPRDILVEVSILRLLPVMSAERERFEKRKVIYNHLDAYLHEGKKLLQQTAELLGRDDLFYESIRKIIDVGEDKIVEMRRVVEKGEQMKDYLNNEDE
jgi:hypothetical protein